MLCMLHMFCVQQPNQVSVFIVTCAIIAGANIPCSVHMARDYYTKIDLKYLDMQNYAMQKINFSCCLSKIFQEPRGLIPFYSPPAGPFKWLWV